jgi:hypothetical protein
VSEPPAWATGATRMGRIRIANHVMMNLIFKIIIGVSHKSFRELNLYSEILDQDIPGYWEDPGGQT